MAVLKVKKKNNSSFSSLYYGNRVIVGNEPIFKANTSFLLDETPIGYVPITKTIANGDKYLINCAGTEYTEEVFLKSEYKSYAFAFNGNIKVGENIYNSYNAVIYCYDESKLYFHKNVPRWSVKSSMSNDLNKAMRDIYFQIDSLRNWTHLVYMFKDDIIYFFANGFLILSTPLNNLRRVKQNDLIAELASGTLYYTQLAFTHKALYPINGESFPVPSSPYYPGILEDSSPAAVAVASDTESAGSSILKFGKSENLTIDSGEEITTDSGEKIEVNKMKILSFKTN